MSDWPRQAGVITPAASGVISTAGCVRGLVTTVAASVAWPAANRAYFVPFTIPYGVVAYKAAFGCGSVAGGNVDMGWYTRDGVRLFSTGAQGRSASNEVIVDIADTYIPAGSYYLAMSHDGTGNLIAMATSLQVARLAGVLAMSTAYVLPDPVTFAALADAFIPSFAVYTRPH